jgi:hypothetical protein
MRLVAILFSIFYGILFIFSIIIISTIYICDTYECKPFTTASKNSPPGSHDYIIILLSEYFNDGIWVFPFIGSTIATSLCLWLLDVPITPKNFTMMFLIFFIISYFMFSFFGHHYIRPLSIYISDFVNTNRPNNPNNPNSSDLPNSPDLPDSPDPPDLSNSPDLPNSSDLHDSPDLPDSPNLLNSNIIANDVCFQYS